ncbi:conserved hypothetical protein [Ricinus communis]|uniref:Uncharacterized protein n=1 Tax=Ricinus communis TaxID=3988 RepID=B9RP69_RICCO|nr:conserved hypothetical protein [Ricinus communis]
MATLERSKVYRRQGSSGPVWDEKLLLGYDKIDYRELRPCQSGSNIRNMDCSSSIAAPTSCPRSLSTPAMEQTYSKGSGKRVDLANPKCQSGKRNLILGILSGNK